MKRQNKSARTAYLAVLLVLALLMSYIEHIVGFDVGVPGVKVGFANIVVLFALYRFGVLEGALVNLCRIVVSGLLFGNGISLIYGLCGGAVAFVFMVLLKKTRFFGVMGVSVVGAVCHNLAQLCVAAFVMGSAYVFSYAPVLLVSGTVFGAVTGALCALLIKKVPENL